MSRRIRKLEELEVLPLGSVVTRNRVPYEKAEKGWKIIGHINGHSYAAASLLLNDNATLISEPGEAE